MRAAILTAVATSAILSTPWACMPLASAEASFQSAPQASTSSRWTLDFKSGEFRLFTAADGRDYWYMTYTVVNRTGQDRMWAPRFDLLSDDGQIRRSGRDVPSSVTSEILRVIGNPLLEDQNQVIGELLQGVENAKEGLVVWPANNLAVKELVVFGSGLSGETKVVADPLTGEDVTLSRTLSRSYVTAGEPALRPSEPLRLYEQVWVWR